jgi:prepilin-type N-terminal cleavage/methylation domain-containing protein
MVAMESPVVRMRMRTSITGSLSKSGDMDEAGYTLIELAAVIALLGLFLGLSIPRFHHALITDELKSTTRKIVGSVKEVRNEAIRLQKIHVLHFDLESNRLWIEHEGMDEDESAMAQQRALEFPRGVRVLDIWCRGKGKQARGEVDLYVSKKGYVEQTVIHLGADDGREYTLELSPFLGTVKFYEKYIDVTIM